MITIENRLKELKYPAFRKMSSKEINEISLFSEERENESEVYSPMLNESSIMYERQFESEIQQRDRTSTLLSRARSTAEPFLSLTKSTLAEKRGTTIRVRT